MKTLFLECSMGAAGDMLTAALLELIPDKQLFLDKINSLALPGVDVSAENVNSCGISGTRVSVKINGAEECDHCGQDHNEHHHHEHHHEHKHTSMHDISDIVSGLELSEKVKTDILAVYSLIAEAESCVHGTTVDQIHFHEVGELDAVADIAGVCILMDMIAADRVIVSPVNTGSGTVHCAHGVLPVPAPATVHLLKGVPVYCGDEEGELCTPTGAALLKFFADEFGKMPVMQTECAGYGIGRKEFRRLNCVRAFLGQSEKSSGTVAELVCTIDDMTGEEIAFAVARLFEKGALDVFTVPVGMKKNRPGVMLNCICEPEQCDLMAKTIFNCTSTLGMRKRICERYVLERSSRTEETPLGNVDIKSSFGYGTERQKAEYDDIAHIARERDISLRAVRELVKTYTDGAAEDYQAQKYS